MDRSLDEIISERPQRGGGGAGRRPDRRAPAPPRGPRRDRDRDEGPRDGVRKNRRDERSDIDGDWVHDRYEEDRGGRRRGGYEDDEAHDRRAPARRAPDDDTGKVRVDNLHYELTEDDITELFNRIGPVLSARLLYDRSDRSQGTAFVTYEDPRDARDAVREFDGANANGQPIRLTLLSSAPRRAPAAADRGSLFDRIEKPSRSMFERIDSSEDVPRRRGGGGRRDDRSYSPPRRGLRVPEGVDRYEPGGRDSRSPLPGRRGGGRERGGRRPGAKREENGREGGRGKKEGGRSGPRPKKTAEELDAEMEDYFGGNGGAAAENNNGTAQQQNGGGAAPAATSAPAAVGDDDIDMIE